MPNYDDFGRPIYETAEEYNRAHGTGGTARTQDSQNRAAYRQEIKKAVTRNRQQHSVMPIVRV